MALNARHAGWGSYDDGRARPGPLRDGAIQGLVVQDPFDMGYRGVKSAVAVLNGEEVRTRVATRLGMVTPENIDEPGIRQLIEPELKKSLE